MSGQWNPYPKEADIEPEPIEASQGVETDDKETDTKSEHRFRRRVD
jgi:hypothetical protein